MFKKRLNQLINLELTYQIGIAIYITITYGLTINYILPKFGINNPLSIYYIWPVYIFFIFPLINIIKRYKSFFDTNISIFFLKILFLINPLIAIAGVHLLDNTGNGYLALLSVYFVCVTFVITLFFKDIKSEIVKLSIYTSSLSLVLANSMRSNFLVGWDIHQEYLVFRLTNLHNFWTISTFKDAYNACLSITILPTIIHNLTNIEPFTIYKFVYPLFIALIPVIVYQIGSRIVSIKLAYIGSFAFLIQGQFFGQLPALLRQSIAFIFFGLIIDLIVRSDITTKFRDRFILFFGIGMILSHYSTTYIALFLMLSALLISIVINKIWPCREKVLRLSPVVISALFFTTFLWNVLITDTADGIVGAFSKVLTNIGTTFSLENKSDVVKGIFYQQSNNTTLVNNYYKKSLESVPNPEKFKGYEIKPISIGNGKTIKITYPIPFYFHVLIPWIFRLSIVAGFIALLIHEFKNRRTTVIISICASMFIIVSAITILPNISSDYNFERLFQQTLFLLAPISALGFYAIFKYIKKLPMYIPISIILISYLLQTTGFIDHIVYNSDAWMFSNGGDHYYRYYSTLGEIKGINWMENNTASNSLLYSDKYTKLRVNSYSNQKFGYISNQINPPSIENGGYIYSGLAGTEAKAVFATISNKSYLFSYPFNYLDSTKNQIYTNSISKIYK